MIILDDSYVSDRMRRYLQESGRAVLESDMARRLQARTEGLNVVAEEEALERIDAGERLYAMSESHFPWVARRVSHPGILHGLSVFKDKEKMRRTLSPLYPELFFQTVDAQDLPRMPFPADRLPFVLKPSSGFLSLGIYPIRSRRDWEHAVLDIEAKRRDWQRWYGREIVDGGRFIMESLIEGTEYALDAYFDDEGSPHVLNILRHDFADAEDTSDRLYCCGKGIMLEKRGEMEGFLRRANSLARVRSFPVHVEVREQDGRIRPIEFNALRFAGLGGTEISEMAFGFRTFEHYLADTEPDWDEAFRRSGDDLYCMSVLAPNGPLPAGSRLDCDRFCAQWEHPIAMDRFDYDETGILGFFFWRTSGEDDGERRLMLATRVEGYLQNA